MRVLPAALALALAAEPALAWESDCSAYPEPSLEVSLLSGGTPCTPARGPAIARGRWVGGLDEHRRLLARALELAGLPAEVARTRTLTVFTGAAPVTVNGQVLTSLVPVPFEEAASVQGRSMSVAEFAQLPDFSYALFDWASGNERCPLPGVGADAETCHDFASHMGPVNSNHFLPQAAGAYRAYHALAVARATRCAQVARALAPAGGRFAGAATDCEFEALSLEAVGQHFLQDAWSMGHMWQRWGSADLSGFPGATTEDRRARAVLVALVSGLIHGSRGVLQALPAWTSYDVDDALCAPSDQVHYVDAQGELQQAVGDDYLSAVLGYGGSGYAGQARTLESCGVAGLLEVYRAAGELHGPAVPLGPLASVEPGSEACFAQRATNQAMVTGMSVDLRVAGAQLHIPLDARTVAALVPTIASTAGRAAVQEALRNRYRLELMRLVALGRLTAAESPSGTGLAEGALGPFLGAAPNGAFAAAPAPSLEPPLPWPASPGADAATAERALWLARAFHRAHAAEWCALEGPAQLKALRAHAGDGSLGPGPHAAACAACAEVALRHLRVGPDAAGHDPDREPLCAYLASGPAFVYQPGAAGDDPDALARLWCGC